jgi:hypothetical protein
MLLNILIHFLFRMTRYNGNALRPLHFNFPSEHNIKSVQQNQEEMELSTTHQLLVDTYDAN